VLPSANNVFKMDTNVQSPDVGIKFKYKRPEFVKQILEQRLPAWEPTLYPPFVISMFFIVSVVLLPIGIGMYFSTIQVTSVETMYDSLCTMQPDQYGAPVCNVSTTITIPRRMDPPIYMYYKLYNFYQNYRKYVNSRFDEQLGGTPNIPLSSFSQYCDQFLFYNHGWNNQTPAATYNNDPQNVYMPCGVIAWSMFNDSFILYDRVNTSSSTNVICNGKNPDLSPNCTKNGIADIGDVKRFRRGASGRNYTTTYFNEDGHYLPDVIDEDFMVWMKTSALSTFRKLYRIINVPLEAGTYTLFIQQRYPVSKFNSQKSLILTTSSWIGGANLFFSLLNIVVGSSSFLIGCFFIFLFIVQHFIHKARSIKYNL
jgi:hypothetical protein